MKHPNLFPSRPASKTGSALITTVIFAMVISMGMAALLPRLLSDWKLTARTSSQEAAFTLAESGIEEGVWAVKQFDADSEWTAAGWELTDDEKFWYREWTLDQISAEAGSDFTLDEGRYGAYRVLVQNTESSPLHVVSQGIVRGGKYVSPDFTVRRYIETEVSRPVFPQGVVAVEKLDFNGQPEFNSLNTDNGGLNSALTQNVVVGSASTDTNDYSLGNAKIFGDFIAGVSADSNVLSGSTVHGEHTWNITLTFPKVVIPNTAGWATSL